MKEKSHLDAKKARIKEVKHQRRENLNDLWEEEIEIQNSIKEETNDE